MSKTAKSNTSGFEPPWIRVVKSRIPENVELLWADCEGSYHLGRRKGNYVKLETYGDAREVYRKVDDFVCYQHISPPIPISN